MLATQFYLYLQDRTKTPSNEVKVYNKIMPYPSNGIAGLPSRREICVRVAIDTLRHLQDLYSYPMPEWNSIRDMIGEVKALSDESRE